MNFLEMCQRAKQECDIPGTLTTVTGQSGELKRLVDWVSTANDEICALEEDWKFLKSNFQIAVVANDQDYEITDAQDTFTGATVVGFGKWLPHTFRIYRNSAGVATERILGYEPWMLFRDVWLLGNRGASDPYVFSIRPHDDCIFLGPKPVADYTITGEYQIEAPTLTEDTEAPLFPQRYHMAVVYLAMKHYARFEEDAGLYDAADREYEKLISALRRYQLPDMLLAGPLV